MLFSEPKIPQFVFPLPSARRPAPVSVLFSEPKIPQLLGIYLSIARTSGVSVLFSEPKIPQLRQAYRYSGHSRSSFSALQRAENSSIELQQGATTLATVVSVLFSEPKIPQLFVASLNSIRSLSFSALQRAENSSIAGSTWLCPDISTVSVLFSEPKIPQFERYMPGAFVGVLFQCSSASRKFLNSRMFGKF